MRKCLLVAFVTLLCATGAICQMGVPVPAQPVPALPAHPAPPPPVAQPLPQPVLPPALATAPDPVTGIPEVDLALSLPATLGKPFVFAVVFLLTGGPLTVLLRRVAVAKLHDPTYARAAEGRLSRQLALGDLIAWMLALYAACEAVSLNCFTGLTQTLMQLIGLIFGLLGSVIGGLFWVAAAGLLAYAISPRGRDLVLSLLGYCYLRWHSARPTPTQEFDLGGGVLARVARTDLLQSLMQSADGKQYLIPNAWLMRTHFNWDNTTPVPPATTTAAPPPPPSPVEETFPAESYPGIAGTPPRQ